MWCVIQLLCQQRGRRREQLLPDPCATHAPFLTCPPSSQLAPTPLVSVLIGKLALAYAVAQQNMPILAHSNAEIAHPVLIWHTSITQTAHQVFPVW